MVYFFEYFVPFSKKLKLIHEALFVSNSYDACVFIFWDLLFRGVDRSITISMNIFVDVPN